MADNLVNITGFNLLPEVAEQLPEIASKVVRKTAFDLQALAQSFAPVEFGFLEASIYVVTHSESTYPEGLTPSQGDGYLLPAVETPPTDLTAIVAVGANYGIYQEFGTVYMGAQPYMTPAAEIVKPQFLAAMEGLSGLLEL